MTDTKEQKEHKPVCTFDPDKPNQIYLEPCSYLESVLNRQGHPHGGLQWHMSSRSHFKEGDPTQHVGEMFHMAYVVALSGPARKQGGVALQSCPFCSTSYNPIWDRYAHWQENNRKEHAHAGS